MEQDLAGARFGTLRIDELAGCSRLAGSQAGAVAGDVFEHDHGVGSARHRRTGHDLDSLTLRHLPREAFARADLADHREFAGEVAGAHRVAVAHRTRQSGVIAIRRNGFAQHSSRGHFECNGLG